MVAADGGTPSKSATATVMVEVSRNLNSPQFTPQRYDATVLETLSAGEEIVAVTAIDRDVVVCI